jgi:ubiquinone/menaquinone biosynthesis C-methylase UbiE
MDYDKTDIAKTYHQARSHGPDFLELWMNTVASHVGPPVVRTVLDLGCGTGRFSEGLATRLNASVIGADPSIKMLGEGKRNGHSRVSYICGPAESIPLDTGSVDLIFISMAFHHFTDPARAAQECRRVLRQNGRLFLRTGCRERVSVYPYVPYFPSSKALIEARLPSLEFQREVFKAASFQLLFSGVVVQEIASDYQEYADKLALKADSVLVSLDDKEFNAGVAAVRAERNPGPISEPIDFVVFGN